MHLISNTSSLKPGLPYTRDTLRQVDNSTNTDPFCVEFEINHPRVAERYYSRNLNIDDSNSTISNWRGRFRPRIGVSKLILQYLKCMMLIPTILVRLVIGGMTGTLQSSITISQRR